MGHTLLKRAGDHTLLGQRLDQLFFFISAQLISAKIKSTFLNDGPLSRHYEVILRWHSPGQAYNCGKFKLFSTYNLRFCTVLVNKFNFKTSLWRLEALRYCRQRVTSMR